MESEEWHSSSSSESEPGQEEANDTCKDIEIGVRGGANVLLNIHDQLDLAKLQQVLLAYGSSLIVRFPGSG